MTGVEVHCNPWFRIVQENSNGHEYFRLEAPDSAIMIGVTADQKIAFVRGTRVGASYEELYELPGGVIDPKENPLRAAIREAKEETGYAVKSVIGLGDFVQAPAISSTRCHVFQGEIAAQGKPGLERGENWETVLLDEAEIFELIACGLIQDAATLSAWAKYVVRRRQDER